MSGSHCAMFPFVLEKLLNALSDWMEMVRVLPQFLSDATYHYHASPWGWFCQSEVQCSRPKGSILVLSDHRIIFHTFSESPTHRISGFWSVLWLCCEHLLQSELWISPAPLGCFYNWCHPYLITDLQLCQILSIFNNEFNDAL